MDEFNEVSDRIATRKVMFKDTKEPLTVVRSNGPTKTSESESEKMLIYEQLKGTLKSVASEHRRTVILGDLNCRVGNEMKGCW